MDAAAVSGRAEACGHYEILRSKPSAKSPSAMQLLPVQRDGNCLFVAVARLTDVTLQKIELNRDGFPLLMHSDNSDILARAQVCRRCGRCGPPPPPPRPHPHPSPSCWSTAPAPSSPSAAALVIFGPTPPTLSDSLVPIPQVYCCKFVIVPSRLV